MAPVKMETNSNSAILNEKPEKSNAETEKWALNILVKAASKYVTPKPSQESISYCICHRNKLSHRNYSVV
jgi:hypothetical protein